MKLLVTGARGYVGRAVINELEQKNVPHYAADFEKFDLTDIESIRAYFAGKDITSVLHLAGAVETNQGDSLFDANIAGLYNLLLICAEAGVKYFAMASTNVVYGTDRYADCKETDGCKPDPLNRYAISKYVGELLVRDFCQMQGINWSCIRIGDIYGPNQKFGKLVKAVVTAAALGEPLAKYGNGTRTRDYIYIDDVAKGLVFILDKALTGSINLSTGIGTSVAQLIKMGKDFSDEQSPILHVEVEHEDTSYIVLDNSVLRNAGFSPKITIKDGLKKCIDERRKDGRA